MELCVETRADIPTDAEKYNLSDFVTYNTTRVRSYQRQRRCYANVTVHDGEYCLHVNDSQTYVAILRSEMAPNVTTCNTTEFALLEDEVTAACSNVVCGIDGLGACCCTECRATLLTFTEMCDRGCGLLDRSIEGASQYTTPCVLKATELDAATPHTHAAQLPSSFFSAAAAVGAAAVPAAADAAAADATAEPAAEPAARAAAAVAAAIAAAVAAASALAAADAAAALAPALAAAGAAAVARRAIHCHGIVRSLGRRCGGRRLPRHSTREARAFGAFLLPDGADIEVTLDQLRRLDVSVAGVRGPQLSPPYAWLATAVAEAIAAGGGGGGSDVGVVGTTRNDDSGPCGGASGLCYTYEVVVTSPLVTDNDAGSGGRRLSASLVDAAAAVGAALASPDFASRLTTAVASSSTDLTLGEVGAVESSVVAVRWDASRAQGASRAQPHSSHPALPSSQVVSVSASAHEASLTSDAAAAAFLSQVEAAVAAAEGSAGTAALASQLQSAGFAGAAVAADATVTRTNAPPSPPPPASPPPPPPATPPASPPPPIAPTNWCVYGGGENPVFTDARAAGGARTGRCAGADGPSCTTRAPPPPRISPPPPAPRISLYQGTEDCTSEAINDHGIRGRKRRRPARGVPGILPRNRYSTEGRRCSRRARTAAKVRPRRRRDDARARHRRRRRARRRRAGRGVGSDARPRSGRALPPHDRGGVHLPGARAESRGGEGGEEGGEDDGLRAGRPGARVAGRAAVVRLYVAIRGRRAS